MIDKMQCPLVTITPRAHSNKMIFYLCFLIIMCGVDARHSVTGLYCQDPDTYKLYPVNATWPSETFCGNYTCRLRKRNHTETEYMPITKINITDKHLVRDINDMVTNPSEQVFSVIKNLKPERPVFHKETTIDSNDINQNKLGDKSDRYLTETEIKAITDVLHTVKKSDLEAIIEIYNLAQDIYKEMDGEKTENLVKETVSIMKQDVSHIKKTDNTKSYFYKPLHQTHMEKNLTDMNNESTRTTPYLRRPPPSMPFPLTYFNGPITSKDFGRTPYYYPMSNFQRSASYVYNKPYVSPMTPPIKPYTQPPVRPCNQPRGNFFPSPWYDRSIIKPYVKQQRPASPMLLPYPFSHIHHYNYSSYPASYYYNHYPWAQLDSYKRKEYSPFNGYSNLTPNEDKKIETSKEKSSEEIKDDVEFEAESTPEWKTKPLSEKILDEVRANILDKSILFPLRKNVKLERVGKVIKLDELTRDKRSVIEVKNIPEPVYEAYIDTTKCEPSTDPGFFRVGNLSAMYPACCPQRIS